jgi:hypothetical protein
VNADAIKINGVVERNLAVSRPVDVRREHMHFVTSSHETTAQSMD